MHRNGAADWRRLCNGFTGPVDALVMNHEFFETAVCAASDLAARLARELAQALCLMEDAERRYFQAAADAQSLGASIPLALRRERNAARQTVAVLRHVLAGMPSPEGGRHAASA